MKKFFCVVFVMVGLLLLPVLTLAQEGETVSVVSFRAPLHEGPTAQSETLVNLPRGTLLTYVGLNEDGMWVEVATPDGLSGWVSRVHVHLNGPYTPPEDGITRTYVDGQTDDWARFYQPAVDPAGDTTGLVDLRAVRAFVNESYAYFLVEVDGSPFDVNLLLLDIVTNSAGTYSTYQFALPQGQVGTLFELTEDAGSARDASQVTDFRAEAIEIRMPLDLLGTPDSFALVGVSLQEETEDGPEVTDSLMEEIPAVDTLEAEPAADGRIVEFRVNMRSAPVNGEVLRVLPPDTEFALMGASADGEWVFVRLDDSFPGWVSAQYVGTETDLASLPVIE